MGQARAADAARLGERAADEVTRHFGTLAALLESAHDYWLGEYDSRYPGSGGGFDWQISAVNVF